MAPRDKGNEMAGGEAVTWLIVTGRITRFNVTLCSCSIRISNILESNTIELVVYLSAVPIG